MVAGHPLDLVLRAQEHRHALVQLGRLRCRGCAACRWWRRRRPARPASAIGLASYIRRSLPAFSGSRLSQGYMKTPPRVRMRCTSATMRGDPAHVEVLAARAVLAGQAFVDVALHRRRPSGAGCYMLIANSLVSSGIRMSSCVSTHEPCSRSSVNIATPSPTVSTSVVCGP